MGCEYLADLLCFWGLLLGGWVTVEQLMFLLTTLASERVWIGFDVEPNMRCPAIKALSQAGRASWASWITMTVSSR